MPENGYFYIYVSNESEKEVNFDNLRISQTSGSFVEENHYYPFGMLIEDLSTDIAKGQKYKYNGKELQTDLNYNVEDYGARHYDPVIARWMHVDPFAEKYRRWSPYNYAVDNPVRYIDPDGNGFLDVIAGTLIGAITDIVPGTSSLRDNYEPDNTADYNDALQATDATMGVAGSAMVKGGGAATATGGVIVATAATVEVATGGLATEVAAPAAAAGVALIGAGIQTAAAGALLMTNSSNNAKDGYDRGKKNKSSTKENTKVKDQKPGDASSDQVEGISRAKDFKGKNAPRGQKQNAINETSKSHQKEKAVTKNLKNIDDVKDSYE